MEPPLYRGVTKALMSADDSCCTANPAMLQPGSSVRAFPWPRWVAAGLLFGLFTPGWIFGGEQPSESTLRPTKGFNPKEGVIDGKVAIGFWPVVSDEDRRPADPTGFEVHLVPVQNLDEELIYKAGAWFQPPMGTYRHWMERDGLMTPSPGVVHYEAVPAEGDRGFAMLAPVVPAGKVRLSTDITELPKNGSFRLLLLETSFQGKLAPLEMTRRASMEAAKAGVRMRTGAVLAGIWDNQAGEYVALAVAEVLPNKTIEVRPTPPPPHRGAAVVTLKRPPWKMGTPPTLVAEDDVAVYLTTPDGEKIAADALGRSLARIYAVWLSLPTGPARLTVEAPEARLAKTVDLPLQPGRVTRQDLELVPLRED